MYSICILHILLSVCFSCTLTWIKGKAQWNTLSQARALAPSSSSTRSPGTYTLYAVWIERRSHTTHYELKRWTSIQPTAGTRVRVCHQGAGHQRQRAKVPEGPYTASVPEMSSVGKKPIRCSDVSFIHLFIWEIMQ